MFKSEFTIIGTHSYKSFKIEDKEMISEYQLSSFEEGNFDFLLPLIINNNNNQMTLNYEIDSSKSLAKYIEDQGRLNKKDFIKIITDISDVLLHKRQQLSSSYFLISIDNIYFKRNRLEPKFIFLPHKSLKDKVSLEIKELILEIVPRKVKYTEAEEMYVEILDAFDRDGYSVNGLREIVDKYRDNQIVEDKVYSHIKNKNNMTNDSDHKPALKSENNNYIDDENIENNKLNIEVTNNVIDSNEEHEVIIEDKKNKNKVLIALLQGIAIMSMALIYFIFSNDLLKVVGGVLGIISIDLLFILLIRKKSKSNNNEKIKTKEIKETKKAKKRISKQPATNRKELEPEEFIENESYKTTFLDERVRLVNSKNKENIIPVIISANRKFKIGRNKNLDLTLDKGTVSYEHAEITTDGNEYYLEDLNSTNSTYLNGQKAIGSKKYPINSGDSIAFADNEYIFYM